MEPSNDSRGVRGARGHGGGKFRSCGLMGRWLRFGLCLGVFWLLVFVVLPLGQRLPVVKPVMDVVVQSGVDAGAYFYTQSEETAYAVMYVKNTVNGVKAPSELESQP